MTDLFSSYRPPGVYSEEMPTPIVSNPSLNPSIIGIVGPTIGYRTASEVVVLNGTSQVRLNQLGITPSSVQVFTDGILVDPSDYSLTPGPGDDIDLGTVHDNTLDIARSIGSQLNDGAQVQVRYRYTDESFFLPLVANSADAVRRAFGEPVNSITGEITSPLTLAAMMAFANGASRVMCQAVPGTGSVTVDDLADAYVKLLAQEAVNIIVPLPVGISGTTNTPGDVNRVGTDLRAHLNQAENDGIYRVGILGYERTVEIDPAVISGTINSKRVMHAYPNKMGYYNGVIGQTMEVGGYYLAAAYAGLFAAGQVQYPITRKQVAGLSSIPNSIQETMDVQTKNGWSSAGVAVTEQTTSRGLVVRHGVSTATSSVLTREMSIIRARDAKLRLIMSALDQAELIGSPIVAETPSRIRGIVTGALEFCLTNGIIVGYDGVSVDQIELDPTVIEVKYQYAPTYPANYILISFGVDITSGIFSVSEDFQGVI